MRIDKGWTRVVTLKREWYSSAEASSKWVCNDREAFQQRASECLLALEQIYDSWLPHRWEHRGLPSHVLTRWVSKEQHSKYPFPYRLAFGHSLSLAKTHFAFTGYIRASPLPSTSQPPLAIDFTTTSPLFELRQLITNNLSLCDTPLLHQLLGFCHTREELILGFERLLLASLAQLGPNMVPTLPVATTSSSPSSASSHQLVLTEQDLQYQLIYSGQAPESPKLFRWVGIDRSGGEWMLVHLDENQQPRITVLFFAHPNKYLRAYQLPVDQFPEMFSVARHHMQLEPTVRLSMSFVVLPHNHVDHQSFYQLKQVVKQLPASIEPWVEPLVLPYVKHDLSLETAAPMWPPTAKAEAETQALYHIKRKTEYPIWLRPLKVK